jgi:hypothetical protein
MQQSSHLEVGPKTAVEVSLTMEMARQLIIKHKTVLKIKLKTPLKIKQLIQIKLQAIKIKQILQVISMILNQSITHQIAQTKLTPPIPPTPQILPITLQSPLISQTPQTTALTPQIQPVPSTLLIAVPTFCLMT